MKAVIKVNREGTTLRIAVKNEGDNPLHLKNRDNDMVVSEKAVRLLRIHESESEVQFEMTERTT